MKLILIGMCIAIALTIAAFFSGYFFSQNNIQVLEMKHQMHSEHTDLSYKIDNLEQKIDKIDEKLDRILNIATRPSAAEIDCRR